MGEGEGELERKVSSVEAYIVGATAISEYWPTAANSEWL
jgi:hypothetical protein